MFKFHLKSELILSSDFNKPPLESYPATLKCHIKMWLMIQVVKNVFQEKSGIF